MKIIFYLYGANQIILNSNHKELILLTISITFRIFNALKV